MPTHPESQPRPSRRTMTGVCAAVVTAAAVALFGTILWAVNTDPPPADQYTAAAIMVLGVISALAAGMWRWHSQEPKVNQ